MNVAIRQPGCRACESLSSGDCGAHGPLTVPASMIVLPQTVVSVPIVVVPLTPALWPESTVLPDLLPCGHPAACVVSHGEGTNYCGFREAKTALAAAEAREARLRDAVLHFGWAWRAGLLRCEDSPAGCDMRGVLEALGQGRPMDNWRCAVVAALTDAPPHAALDAALAKARDEAVRKCAAAVAALRDGFYRAANPDMLAALDNAERAVREVALAPAEVLLGPTAVRAIREAGIEQRITEARLPAASELEKESECSE